MERRPTRGHPDHDACGTGFVVRLGGAASHEVVERGLEALRRLSHRGGVDADGSSGDGAGLMTAIPDRFMRRVAGEVGITLPDIFAVGMFFLAQEHQERVRRSVETLARTMGVRFLSWREAPVNAEVLGSLAQKTLPSIQQCFLAPCGQTENFEARLFLLRKRMETALGADAYCCSLSTRTVVYKGLLAPWQLAEFYPDLQADDFESRFAIFHQRFSTNTCPSWSLAQPFRLLAHNGEINTITGNRRWMSARENEIRAGSDAGPWFHALEEGVSDSASLDNAIEVLVHQGKSIAHAMLSLVPPALTDGRLARETLEIIKSSAHEYEPWDGPAALVFTDGTILGARLDRNGLRPMRYTRTSTGWLVAGSETGLADFDDRHITEQQRLGPGEALLIDIATGQVFPRSTHVIESGSLKRQSRNQLTVRLQPGANKETATVAEPGRLAAAMGWTADQISFFLQPLAQGKEPTYSMGDDTPPAFLSKMRRTLWDYCKQRFAQVTNPPMDPLREAHVMSLEARIGNGFVADSPLLDEQQMHALEHGCAGAQRVDVTFEIAQGVAGALIALDHIRSQVCWDFGTAPSAVIVSDRGVSDRRAALPILLCVAMIWKQMVSRGYFRVPLIVETAQVIEVHHLALLLAVGAAAVRPFLAQQLAEDLVPGGAHNYRNAMDTGLKKVLSRMGISTLASYRNGRLFEVIGLDETVCRDFFEDAHCWDGPATLSQLLEDYLFNHAQAFRPEFREPGDAGLYRFRKLGEQHATSADLLRKLHAHIKEPGAGRYQEFEALAENRAPVAVRDLLKIVAGESVSCEFVESEADILRRFSAQAMSVGALSPEAHRTLALAMNALGARSNTGEGGEDPEIYSTTPEAACRVKQIASGRFGVTAEYLVHAEEIEIKIAQGSKPGEGGQLPASKVTAYIATLRHAVPGMALISPPPHHDIYSIEDLEQLIHDLRQINPVARIGVKLVAGAGVGIIAAGVAKAGADVITISGYDGGTGASPLSSIKNTGAPWEYGLRDAHCTLIKAGLRQYVRLRVDGGLKFARDVILAALLGADEFGFGTAALLAMGCVMARQCHLNTCPVGIATQDETLRTRFTGRPEMVQDYFQAVAAETRVWLGRLGARSLEEIVGRTDLLAPRTQEACRWLRGLLQPMESVPHAGRRRRPRRGLSQRLLEIAKAGPEPVQVVLPIVNADRSIGAELAGEWLRRKRSNHDGVPLELHFKGTAGQSFGAFLSQGMAFHLNGSANDYVAKGLSGGTISITAGNEACRRRDVLAGNTVLYGATSGELYIAGQAGERFAVRNSGAASVVEGVGDYACEYMTGGVVVILGPAGINLGSGMTGGLTYLFTEHVSVNSCNTEFVRLQPCTVEEEHGVRQLLIRHWTLTHSPNAASVLESGRRLSIVRMQPLNLPCAVSDTWKPILQRFERDTLNILQPPQPSMEPWSQPGQAEKHARSSTAQFG